MKRRSDGRWVKVRVIEGVSVPFYSRAESEKKAEKDIERQMIEYKTESHKKKHNFKCLGEKMLEKQSKLIQYNTEQSYKYSFKYLEPLYDYDIENITPDIMQKLLNDMVIEKDYSFSAVSKAKVLYGMIVDYAIIHENLQIFNFSKSLRIPKKAKKGTITAPSDETIKVIKENASKVEFGMWSFIFLCTGLRRGEQAAIQKKKIDFEKNEILIDDAVEFIVNQPHLKGIPKTDESKNTVPILPILKPLLKDMCKNLGPDDFIFGGKKPLTKTQIDKRLKKYCKTIGHSYKGHQIRHAYAKLLYEAGVDVKTMQRLLRHKNIQTTMNIYAEFSKKKTDKSVMLLEEHLKTL